MSFNKELWKSILGCYSLPDYGFRDEFLVLKHAVRPLPRAPWRAHTELEFYLSGFINFVTTLVELVLSCTLFFQRPTFSPVNLVDTKSRIMDPVMAGHGWLCGACAPAHTFRHQVLCRTIFLQIMHPCVYVFTFLKSRPHTAFMTCCSNVKL
jgi:hypothetical protein